ncbi:DUF3099 domain-containing protein [Compostimonas suwonensis]|uniref:DUF3099 family protein n=1 Tax=Compostimonas suwonensis TaxID=1048394 RepID=A0A2M9BYP8_9MICO|nr:DUF3099 domain-containing protein [Compostimonas suwonensis]PJJ63202.1 Protein of unknown function (DUF3099) [Compostimonas suwonensis]
MKQPSITSLPQSPDAERRARMIKYTVAMSIRVVCVLLLLVVRGWWLVVVAAGAIFLPYFAVVIANVGAKVQPATVERPGAMVRLPRQDGTTNNGAGAGPRTAGPHDTGPHNTGPHNTGDHGAGRGAA